MNARKSLQENLKKFFEENEIFIKGKLNVFSTPNRLVVHIDKLTKQISKKSEEIRGPNIKSPDKALEGFLRSGDNKIRNLPGTAEIMELARDSLYTRGDLNQIAVWKDGVHAFDKKLYYYQAIHQESDVIPENIDAIRAMFKLESDNMKSIHKTNKALGIS